MLPAVDSSPFPPEWHCMRTLIVSKGWPTTTPATPVYACACVCVLGVCYDLCVRVCVRVSYGPYSMHVCVRMHSYKRLLMDAVGN